MLAVLLKKYHKISVVCDSILQELNVDSYFKTQIKTSMQWTTFMNESSGPPDSFTSHCHWSCLSNTIYMFLEHILK